MEFRVLGPLEVLTAGGAVPLTGPKRRALLARFLVSAGEALSGERLADELWHGSPPRSAATTLQTFVYQLRRRYGVEGLRTTPAGYVLDVAPEQIDAQQFERSMHVALAGALADPADASRVLLRALGMWRGPAYVEFAAEPWAAPDAARLDQLRLDAVEAWASTAIGSGDTSGLIAELEAWTNRASLRESLWALRVLALAQDGRSAEAVRVATNLREILRDELGVDPSAQFLAIETAILRSEPLPTWPDLGGFGLEGARTATPTAAVTPRLASPSQTTKRSRRPAALRRTVEMVRPSTSNDLFVGRVAELRALEEVLETASSGLPQVVLISGEAGIGKSRLLDEFTPHAIARGVQVLAGVCQEDVAVPYLPLASAFAALGPEANPFEQEALTRNVGADDDRGRRSLFLAAARSLLAAASERVTMLVVEDLHWVDDAALELLRHVLAVVGEDGVLDRARLLIMLTTRPSDPFAASAGFVSRLRREHRTTAIDLRALTEHECRELISDWMGARPARATIDRLFEATGGNPLVLQSALGRLREGGAAITDSALADLVGPTDLDHELWRRVEQVSNACSEMLLSAAFLGDGATLDFLATACGLDATTLDDLIEEAGARQVLVADDERYWFAHPQLRSLVYHWPVSDERAGRHLLLADRLAPAGADVRVIAHHLVRAGALVARARLLATCGEAADRSAAVGAWRDAARYASVAFQAAEILGLPDEDLASMQLRAGHAALLAHDRDAAVIELSAAAERARSCAAIATWGWSLVHLARERVVTTELRAVNARSLQSLDEFLAAAGEREPVLRAMVHALEAELYFDVDDLAAAHRHAAIAEDLAAELHDDELRMNIAFARGLHHLGTVELLRAREQFEAARPLAVNLTDPSPRISCVSRLGLIAYVTGALDEASAQLGEALDGTRSIGQSSEYSFAASIAASVAVARGRMATAESHGERARRAYLDAEYWFTPAVLFPTLAVARANRGDSDGARAALDEWDAIHERRSRRYRPLVAALLGDLDAARGVLASAPFRLFTHAPPADLFVTGSLAAQVELGALVAMPELVCDLVDALVELYERGLRFTVGWPSFVPRVVALGFAAIERFEDADNWFDRALDDALASGASMEVARTALDHARVLGARPVVLSARVDERLRIARDAYTSLGIEPRVAGSSSFGIAEAHRSVAGAEHTRIVLVTDLVGSTTLNDALGDRAYLDLLREHDEIIRRRLAEHDGVEFKHTGDGIGAWFFSVSRALACAIALANDFAARSVDASTAPLRVKIALAAGEPTLVDGDLFGLAVTVAFRVLDLGTPGEVLVTSDVAGLTRGLPWSFETRGHHRLKGLSESVDVLRASPQP